MSEMDPDGNGEVTLEEFSAWWDVNVDGNGGATDSGSGRGGADAAAAKEITELRKQLEVAAASPRSGSGGSGGADVKKLRADASAAEAAAAEARDSLAAAQQELAQLKTKLKAAESSPGKQGAGDGSGGGEDSMGMMTKVQEWMEKAMKAEAELSAVTRERDRAIERVAELEASPRLSEMAGAAAGGGGKKSFESPKKKTPSRTASGVTDGSDSDDDDDDEEDLRESIEMLEGVVAARDAEVVALTEKLKAFAAETRKLMDQLSAENAKSKELAGHFSQLQGDLDGAEAKLDEMAQQNRSYVRHIGLLLSPAERSRAPC